MFVVGVHPNLAVAALVQFPLLEALACLVKSEGAATLSRVVSAGSRRARYQVSISAGRIAAPDMLSVIPVLVCSCHQRAVFVNSL